MFLKLTVNKKIISICKKIDTEPFDSYLATIDKMNLALYPKLKSLKGETLAKYFLLRISNLLVAKYESHHRHTHLLSSPFSLIVDPANGCGLRCPGCVHSENPKAQVFDWPSGIMNKTVFEKFVNRYAPYAFDMYFCSYGEPLLNKATPAYIDSSRKNLLPSWLSTSLSFPKLDCDALVESGLHYMIISIDGTSQKNYEIFRKRGNLDLVFNNIDKLVEAKERLSSYTPFLNWQFLMFEHNKEEIDQAKIIAKEIGVNQLSLVQPFSVSWDDPSIVPVKDIKNEYIFFNPDWTRYKAALNNMLGNLDSESIKEPFNKPWLKRYEENKEYIKTADKNSKYCGWLYKNINMDALGRIMPCTRPPSTTDNLVYDQITKGNDFNTAMHTQARQFSGTLSNGHGSTNSPYCLECTTQNNILDIGTEQVKEILNNISLYDILSEQTKIQLTNW